MVQQLWHFLTLSSWVLYLLDYLSFRSVYCARHCIGGTFSLLWPPLLQFHQIDFPGIYSSCTTQVPNSLSAYMRKFQSWFPGGTSSWRINDVHYCLIRRYHWRSSGISLRITEYITGNYFPFMFLVFRPNPDSLHFLTCACFMVGVAPPQWLSNPFLLDRAAVTSPFTFLFSPKGV